MTQTMRVLVVHDLYKLRVSLYLQTFNLSVISKKTSDNI